VCHHRAIFAARSFLAQDELVVAIGEVVNVLREGGPVEVRPKVVLAG